MGFWSFQGEILLFFSVMLFWFHCQNNITKRNLVHFWIKRRFCSSSKQHKYRKSVKNVFLVRICSFLCQKSRSCVVLNTKMQKPQNWKFCSYGVLRRRSQYVKLDYISSLMQQTACLGKICGPIYLGPKLAIFSIFSVF